MTTITQQCLNMTGLFEAEVLVRLLLYHWQHPLANDLEFANDLLESASMALRASLKGEELIEGVPPERFSLIAAIWYAEYCTVTTIHDGPEQLQSRRKWLESVRKALPSCFCDPNELC